MVRADDGCKVVPYLRQAIVCELPGKDRTRTSKLQKGRVITYCGGGIAVSNAAFVLTLLGVANVAVYGGSIIEWAADPTLPLVTGEV